MKWLISLTETKQDNAGADYDDQSKQFGGGEDVLNAYGPADFGHVDYGEKDYWRESKDDGLNVMN